MNSTDCDSSTTHSSFCGKRSAFLIIVESCILMFLSFFSLLGNVFVCVAIYRRPSLRTITNVFILSLAVSDLLTSLLVLFPLSYSSILDTVIFQHKSCLAVIIIGYSLSGTSIFTLSLTGVNRYVRVVKPSLYPKIFTKRSASLMTAAVWVGTFFVCSTGFSVVKMDFIAFKDSPTLCRPVSSHKSSWDFLNASRITCNLLPSLVIGWCYTKVFKTIRQHNSAVAPSLQPAPLTYQGQAEVNSLQGGTSVYGVEERKITGMLTAVLVGFYICWSPFLITVCLSFFGIFDEFSLPYSNFHAYFPVYASSMINPIIYAAMSRSFRKEFLKIFRNR